MRTTALSTRQRDIISALVGGGGMSCGELSVLFRDDPDRQWRDFSTQGIYDALCRLEQRGRVSRRRVMGDASHAVWAWSVSPGYWKDHDS